jgi:hypothetical protein
MECRGRLKAGIRKKVFAEQCGGEIEKKTGISATTA